MIEIQNIHKSFGRLEVLKGIDARIEKGEIVAIVGASGAGKTTLLQIVGTLEKPDAGQVLFDGASAFDLREKELSAFRNRHIGFIFQFHQLLPEFTALENVMLPALIARTGRSEAHRRAADLLDYLGLSDRASHKPAQLSGGEKQRVAVARALAHAPKLVIADEPTGNIDPELSLEMMELLERVSEMGITVLVVTHEHELVHRFHQRVVTLKNGRIISDIPADPEAIAARSAELNAWKELTEPVDDEPDGQNDETKEKEAATV